MGAMGGDGTVFRVLVEFYADRSIGPGLVQRYGSLETAQQVLEAPGLGAAP